jgi:hypothetical protein
MSSRKLAALHRRNVRAAFDAAWYERAHELCADLAGEHGLPVDTVCGVVAAMSPACPWDDNLRRAGAFIRTGRGHTGTQNRKAARILRGVHPLEVLSGDKERAFYMNLSCPGGTDAVTVDRHISRVILGRDRPSRRQYAAVADVFRGAAHVLNMPADALQASIWAMAREGRI